MASSRGRTKSRFWLGGDEEMAKKDDDLHARHPHPHPQAHLSHDRPGSSSWQAARPLRHRSLARIAIFAALLFLCIFGLVRRFSSASGSDSNSADRSGDGDSDGDSDSDGSGSLSGYNGPPSSSKSEWKCDRSYNGPPRFNGLASSLRNVAMSGGKSPDNKNVLFAAASIESVSSLLPLACRMAEREQNVVHFAFMGRDPGSIQSLRTLNGVDASCKVTLHDARPDQAPTSSEKRMEIATMKVFSFFGKYMHPQVVIVDGSDSEERYMLLGARRAIPTTTTVLIELPARPETHLAWISELDTSSLAAWHKVHFDIVIQAPPTGSANMQRLLGSLMRTDLSALSTPHLTVDLPSVVDTTVAKMLASFNWPPTAGSTQLGIPQMLSLRHRIARPQMNEEESSIRFMESFWPKRPDISHVLILGPNTEVSPQFFHYVKYMLLTTLYSADSIAVNWQAVLLGISLVSPDTLLDSTTAFQAPPGTGNAAGRGTPFLWQSPNSDASLILGSRWTELHGYMSEMLEKQQSRSETPAMVAKKEVSKKHPAWLEYILQLARLRGYVMLYPSPDTANVIMGAHSDLSDTPEEYLGDDETKRSDDDNGLEDRATSRFDPASKVDMLSTLPDKGKVIALKHLPVVAWTGKPSSIDELDKDAQEYARRFRREVGECEAPKGGDEDPPREKYAGDLFCSTKEKA